MFGHLATSLSETERIFWERHPQVFDQGPIHAARYERYLARFSWIGLRILGKKRFMGLFEGLSVEEQREYFDAHLASGLLRGVFKVAFHPRVYRKRGIERQGLVHSGTRDIAEFFFRRFRDFCTSTPAKDNYFLQITFFGHVLSADILPGFLKPDNHRRLRDAGERLVFHQEPITEFIRRAPKGRYNGFALSNVGDWMSKEDFQSLLEVITSRAGSGSRILLRFIHFDHPIPVALRDILEVSGDVKRTLEETDRFPFYSLSPMRLTG
jgi:S-adenosylmethionine:diacylglycerol 3-amino-3-carboxypropyl transferase